MRPPNGFMTLINMALLSLPLMSPAVATARPQNGATAIGEKVEVWIGAGRMTVKLVDAPLMKVLRSIADQLGARIVFHAPTDKTLSLEFKDLSVEDGLRRLLQGRNYVFYYVASDGPRREASSVKLTQVRIFGDGMDRDTQVLAGTDAKRLAAGKDGAAPREGTESPKETGSRKSISELARALTDEQDSALRKAAVEALGKTRSDEAVDPLATALSQDSSAAVREAAAHALGKTWSENAVEPLTMALLSDSNAGVREEAAWGLAQTAGQEAVAALTQALTQDRRWYVRDAAASALGTIGGTDALDALRRALADDAEAWVRETAALAAMDAAR